MKVSISINITEKGTPSPLVKILSSKKRISLSIGIKILSKANLASSPQQGERRGRVI